mmetsp:Transcript_14470/g.23950  ORF Transcript_14470/g.23950 Transcript_14470/m.23950 type:complete len:190 (+) Transcript_14470:95-664(+)
MIRSRTILTTRCCMIATTINTTKNTAARRYLSRRSSPLESAKIILGLDSSADFTARQLRSAYLEAAKKSHPDLANSKDGNAFKRISEAYEFLQTGVSPDSDLGITIAEDASFRQSCEEWLGVKAEVVEESKRCPIFREWLEGRTDSAFRWKMFFALHGGLAPMLRPPAALLEDDGNHNVNRGVTRRRRK